jgi:hypothetical protein
MPTTSASKNDAPATTSTANTANCHRNVLLVSMRVPLQNGILRALGSSGGLSGPLIQQLIYLAMTEVLK